MIELLSVIYGGKSKDVEKKIRYALERDKSLNFDDVLYEVISLELPYHIISSRLEKGLIGWKNPVFEVYEREQRERDEFIEKPPEVVEGVFVCKKCGSNKTYSVSSQVRSADEGTSIFVMCVTCSNRWRES